MKYIIVLGDGMAGEPLEQLKGKTTLEAAHTPMMDELAKKSEIGLAYMVPKGMSPGSDTANLSVAGYNPKQYYSGRSPLEALSIGVNLEPDDISFRCNLVTLSQGETDYEERVMLDHSSGEISTKDATVLLKALKKGLQKEGYHFYAGTSYRHLLVWNHGQVVELTPPHDILTKRIGEYLPENKILCEMMEKSYDILMNHPLNIQRIKDGKNPANSAWFWGAGTKPNLPSFMEKTGKRAIMISAVDLLKGIAVGTGMDVASVEGANGGLDTNYKGKAMAAVHALLEEGYDFAYVHVEAPDEMGHQGSIEHKMEAIENLDQLIITPIVRRLEAEGEAFRILILPDHPTPICVRTHTADPIPYLLYDSHTKGMGATLYNEKTGKASGIIWTDGYRLIDHLLAD